MMNWKTLASDTLELCRTKGFGVATAESCTGGLVGGTFTAIPGSSDTYRGGVISYTNEVKKNLLGVPGEVLEQYGAVSEPVAKAMALGACKATGAEVGISTTGLAGPGGDDEFGNPVGTVWIGCAVHGKATAQKFLFEGDREEVRRQAVEEAILMAMMSVANQ